MVKKKCHSSQVSCSFNVHGKGRSGKFTKNQYSNHGNSQVADNAEKFLINSYSCTRIETFKIQLLNFHKHLQ